MTAQEIKTAIDEGKVVYWKQENYPIIKSKGDYLIKCTNNNHMVGLCWQDGTLSAPEAEFFIKEESQLELQKEVVRLAKINIVTCGRCGSVLLHRIFDEEIKCPDCLFESEPCDFPDLNY